ncbi:2-amino-5-chloromuconate deaminase CnbZ [Roseiflexus castenholzii]|uniref:2-amino-5-chloromuconate deaminase CnbZ n=1 Tax=Roseiflexus castenholzii TaxID=120962 RepID=UPI003C7AE9B4
MQLVENPAGGFAFLPGGPPYSAGVVALPGFEIVRATLQRPPPYREGFALIDRHLEMIGRPAVALCAIELRSPKPWSMEDFGVFNAGYRVELETRGILLDGTNPVARTNVAPAYAPPEEPSLYAFSYTIPASAAGRTFVIAGAGDLDEHGIIAEGQTSPEAMRTKANFVMDVMMKLLTALGCGIDDVTNMAVYSVHSPLDFVTDTLLAPLGSAAVHAFHWYYSRPPVIGLEFEVDMRGVRQDVRLW